MVLKTRSTLQDLDTEVLRSRPWSHMVISRDQQDITDTDIQDKSKLANYPVYLN